MEQTLIIGERESIYFQMHSPEESGLNIETEILKVDGHRLQYF